MNYTEFIQAITQKLKEYLTEDQSIQTITTLKNNDQKRIGLTIHDPSVNISPTIYLEEYYQLYQQTQTDLDELCHMIHALYQKVKYDQSCDIFDFEDYALIKHKVFLKLVHTSSNLSYLETVPHKSFLDLSILCYLLYDSDVLGTATIVVNEELLRMWNISFDTLYLQALRNSEQFLPYDFRPIHQVIEELLGVPYPSEVSLPSQIFILTNSNKIFGASSLLYPNVLEHIGSHLKENYYILPSSIHEVIIVPESFCSGVAYLNQMIQEINQTEIPPEDVLSDHTYYYHRVDGRITY